jgi:beta-1,4-mannosyl-glycoprotein beta-1,4-N-acetylglucosaminyltransferase
MLSKNADGDDYIMISDVDEIPNIKKFKKILNSKYTVFEQKNFFYKFNLGNKTIPKWYGSRVCKKKYLKSPQWLRNQKVKNFSIFKFYKIRWNIIKDGGWHFSFLMKPKEIQKKIKSFAHSEFNKEKFTNLKRIIYRVKNKIDIFDRKQLYERVKLDNDFPKYIKKNLKKFKDWFI